MSQQDIRSIAIRELRHICIDYIKSKFQISLNFLNYYALAIECTNVT